MDVDGEVAVPVDREVDWDGLLEALELVGPSSTLREELERLT